MSTGIQTPHVESRRMSVEDYHRMIDTGTLPEGGQYELLNGEIVEKMTKHPPHVITNRKADLLISSFLPDGWHVRIQDPVTLDDSEPEPDLAVVRGVLSDYSNHHPGPDDVCLLMEVADTSLAKDREKASIYARNKIPSYWIINVTGRSIEVYSEPKSLEDDPSYVRLEVYAESDSISLTIDGTTVATVTVADLLP